jgi:hypothetical protein
MGQAIASRGPRWLLPAFLLLTPGVHALLAAPRPEHFTALGERGFLLSGKDPASHERVLAFGGAGERMGEEFFQGWRLAIGLEVAAWTTDGALPLFEAFLAPTARANHLVDVQPDRGGQGIARHEALSGQQLFARLAEVIASARAPSAPERARLLGGAARQARGAAGRTCTRGAPAEARGRRETGARKETDRSHVCGHASPATKKFCGDCGRPLGVGARRAQHAGTRPRA